MDLKKIINVIGLTLFWAVWIYGIISLGVMSQYGRALKAGYLVITGQEVKQAK
jgi:hypothetical protein